MYGKVGLSLLKNGASSLALAVVLGGAAWAGGLPGHGHFASGQGAIRHRGGGALVIDQASQTGIIDWKSFSIGKANRVSFDNGHGATLNLVTGGNASRISGHLQGTGSVYLLNPQGVVITGSGRVNTQGSFAASSRAAADDLFANGRKHLRLTGKAGGDVIDAGRIRSADGTVTLSGRNTTVSGAVSGARVNLVASDEVKVAGAVSAQAANGNGGTIIATGRFANIAANAHISASGRKGGIVLVGGDEHGGASPDDDLAGRRVRNAMTTLVQKGAQISANGKAGSGGHVVVWSQKATEFDGRIAARGTRKGHGGSAEVSSHGNLAFQGLTNLTAAHGTTGELLLDPWDLTIKATGQTTNVNASNGTFESDGPDSVLLVSAIKKALKNGSVGIMAADGAGNGAGDILVDASFSINTSHYLTLSAFHNIIFHDGVTLSNAGSGNLALYADNTGQNLTGTVKFKGSSSINWSGGGQVFLRYNPVDFAHPTNYAARISVAAPNDLTAYMLIHDIQQLQSLQTNLSGTYQISEDIDASATKNWNSGAGFIPISNFTGKLSGDGFTVTNLTIKDSTDGNVGLFSTIATGANVQSIILRNPHISSANHGGEPNVGALAGFNNGTVYGIQVIGGKVSATGPGLSLVYVGGIVGDNESIITFSDTNGTVVTAAGTNDRIGGVAGYNGNSLDAVSSINSTVKGAGTSDAIGGIAGYNSVSGLIDESSLAQDTVRGLGTTQDIGGFVGHNLGTIGSNTKAAGTVSGIGGDEIGGFAGVNDAGATIDDQASSTATVTGTDASASFDIGGFAGLNLGTLTRVSFNGKVSANSPAENEVGGLVGNNGGVIDKSSALGTVSILAGDGNGGGLVGRNRAGGAITRSYAMAHVITAGDNSFIGGLVGQDLGGTILASYAGGPVTANGSSDDAGGLAGYSQGTIDQSYAYGWVTGTGTGEHLGGLLGYSNGATITNSYWDLFTSGLDDTSKGVGNVANASGVTGEDTSTLENGFLPSGFSGANWSATASAYPWLNWAGQPDTINTAINLGAPVPATGSVIVRVDGKNKGSGWIGADGAIYIALPHASLSNGKAHTVFLYFATGPLKTNIFYTGITSGYSDGGLFQDYLQLPFVSHLSATIKALKAAIKGAPADRLLFSIGSGNQLITKKGKNLELTSKASASSLLIDDPMNVHGTLLISSSKPVTQTKPIDATSLALSVTGNVTLKNKNNDVALLAGDVNGDVDFNTDSALTIGSAGFSTGLNVQGDVFLTAAGGDLTLDDHVRAQGSGDALVLAANGSFVNNAGKKAVAVTSGGGRYLIFAQKAGTKIGGLVASQLTGPLYAFDFTHRTYTSPKHKGNLILFP